MSTDVSERREHRADETEVAPAAPRPFELPIIYTSLPPYPARERKRARRVWNAAICWDPVSCVPDTKDPDRNKEPPNLRHR